MKLIIGCPSQNREWILPKWKEHLDKAVPKDWTVEFALIVPWWDSETIKLLSSWDNTATILSSEASREDKRDWAESSSYERMVDLRNKLLNHVRIRQPDLFLSIDSDILCDENLISNLWETMLLNNANAVGGLTWLDQVDQRCTNIANWQNPITFDKFWRIEEPGQHEVDILMAIKLMDNLAYNINYEFNNLGEDFGWSKNLKRAGGKLYCDGRAKNKHCMTRDALDRIDRRVGW